MLGFHTTQMQYARLIDKGIRDLKSGRGNPIENISKIMNYGLLQPLLFNSLQLGAFMLLFQEDSEEGTEKKLKEVIEGSAASLVEGTGTWGVVANMLYKAVDKFQQEKGKEFDEDGNRAFPGPQYWKVGLEVLRLSPSIGGKVKLGMSAMYDQMYKNKDTTYPIYAPDHPDVNTTVKLIQMATNMPLKEVYEFYGACYKVGVQFIGTGASQMDAIKVAAIALGWPEWQLESGPERKERQEKEQEESKHKRAETKIDIYNKAEQENILKQYGVSEEQIKSYKNQTQRIEAIKKLRKSKKEIHIPNAEVIEKEKKQKEKEKEEKEKAKNTSVPVVNSFNKTKPSERKKIEKDNRTSVQTRLYKLKKQSQIDTLISLGVNKEALKDLIYEEDRVREIERLYKLKKDKETQTTNN